MKCRGDTEILHELVHDTLRKLEKQKLIRVVSWTNSWSTYLGVPATFHFFSNSVSTVSLICTNGEQWRQNYFGDVLNCILNSVRIGHTVPKNLNFRKNRACDDATICVRFLGQICVICTSMSSKARHTGLMYANIVVLAPWQARFLCGESNYFWDSA